MSRWCSNQLSYAPAENSTQIVADLLAANGRQWLLLSADDQFHPHFAPLSTIPLKAVFCEWVLR